MHAYGTAKQSTAIRMKILMFYHSLLSDWNHGNAHFLRGIATELLSQGHTVSIFEPQTSWSLQNLLREHGEGPLRRFRANYPGLDSTRYDLNTMEIETVLEGADLVLIHEWNDPSLVREIGRHHGAHGGYTLLFHDTHHRMVTEPDTMSRYDLSNYDGVLAYGGVLRELYEKSRRVAQAWTWHEAADARVFRPLKASGYDGDLVWIGNWGDGERTGELEEFLIRPCARLSLKTRVHGVRYPESARALLQTAGIEYSGWLPNFEVPATFARFKVTVHVPRRPYVRALPGIPTIRPFEALACGIPLVCAPWDDVERLFTPGLDYLVVRNEDEMTRHLRALMRDEDLRADLATHGLETIRARHTCSHRVEELLRIHNQVRGTKLSSTNPAIPETASQI